MNSTEQKSKISKEEKSTKKLREKELFQKYKVAFEEEMNEKSALFARNISLISIPLSILLIVSDRANFASYPELPIIRVIAILFIILFFILTRFKALKNYFNVLNTLILFTLITQIALISPIVKNLPSVTISYLSMFWIIYLFSNLSTLKTNLFVLLNIVCFISINILLKNEMNDNLKGPIINLIAFTGIGSALHNIIYRLKKRDLVKEKLLDTQNQQMTKELKIGQAVQESLMGSLPQKLGYLPLFLERHPYSEVSGDFYDLVKINDRQYYLFMGDVSGHGVSAALITTMAKSLFNSIVSENLSTAEICCIFNKKLAGELLDSNYYLTGIVLKIDPESKVIEYTNAGHTEPYFYKKAENKLEKLSTEDPILGMFEAEYKSKSILMKEGDRLLLYTDGLYEAKNEKDEQYADSFDKDFLELSASAVPNLSKALFEKAAKWGGEKGFNDDVTLLSLEG
jgi:sigma-B regulation protein RsbU (phosphoserine phosphatase)